MNKNYYIFRASNDLVVRCLRGASAARMTGGGGGWEIVKRPRRVSMTIWRGSDPYMMEIPVLFDGNATGTSVETAVSILNQMQMSAPLQDPPHITIEGGLPIKGATWVIDNIDWDPDPIYQSDGEEQYRTRQAAVVNVIQFRPEVFVEIKPTGRTVPNTYKTKTGDTLRSIALNKYGDTNKWRAIAAAQSPPMRILGNQILAAGIDLRIP